MIIVDVEPNSPEWRQERSAIPTASEFDKILTPKDLKYSASAFDYQNRLLSEWICGSWIDWGGKSGFMDRGTELEGDARAYYEWKHNIDVQRAGLILRDDRMVGCSPDGLVGEDGGLEIKVPAMNTHVGYLRDSKKLTDEYRSQVQGSLYITGRRFWDLLSFHPTMPSLIVRVLPEPAYQEAIGPALDRFIGELLAARVVIAPNRFEQKAAA